MGTGSEAVSAVANSVRDVDGVKKKWADLSRLLKKRSSEIKGAKKMTLVDHRLLFLDAFEEKVLSVIGDTAVTCVKSGWWIQKVSSYPSCFRYSEHQLIVFIIHIS